MDSNDLDEFAEIVGTKVSKKGWHLYFDTRGFIVGIASPVTAKGIWHHKFIKNMVEARDFLCAHNQPELIKGLYKIGYRGNARERIRSE